MKMRTGKRWVKPVTGLVVALLLTACGGGGGSGSGSAGNGSDNGADSFRGVRSDNGLVTLNNAMYAGPEGQPLDISGAFPAPESVQVSGDFTGGISVVETGPNRLTLALPQVDRPLNAGLTLSFRFADDTAEVEISVVVQNASAVDLETTVQNTLDQKEELLSLTQDAVLYKFFLQMGYLSGDLTNSQLQARLAEFQPDQGPWAFDVGFALENLQQNEWRYRQGEISEAVLQRELDYAQSMIVNHGAYGREQLSKIRNFITAVLPDGLAGGQFVYVDEAAIYSRFLGSSGFVDATGQGLELSPAYRSIASLVQVRKNQTICCEVMQ